MKRILIFCLLFVLVVAAAVNAALLMPPTSLVRPMLVDGVRTATGLELVIKGPIGLRLYPSLNLRADGVTLANPAATGSARGDTPLLQARSIELRTPLWPLVRGQRQIESIRLVEPTIIVAIDADGRPDWSGTGGPQAAAAAGPAETKSPPQAAEAPVSNVVQPGVSAIAISGGTIEFKDARDGLVARLTNVEASATGITATGFAKALIVSADGTIGLDGQNVELTASGLAGTASGLAGEHLETLALTAKSAVWRDTAARVALAATEPNLSARNIGVDSISAIALSSRQLSWQDDASKAVLTANAFAMTADQLAAERLKSVALRSETVAWTGATTGGTPAGIELRQLAVAAPNVAIGEPLDATITVNWKGEPVTARARLPSPESLAMIASGGQSVAAVISASAAQGHLDFDGDVTGATSAGGQPLAKGRAKAETAALETLARMFGVTLPAGVTGAASIDGSIEATPLRLSLTNGRISHDGATATGSLTVDLGGPRPAISGKLATDKLDGNRYLGLSTPPASPVATPTSRAPGAEIEVQRTTPPVPVKDALKAYMRAILDTKDTDGSSAADVDLIEVTQSASVSRAAKPVKEPWSDAPLDLTPLRSVDLDLDVAVGSLKLSSFDLAVPRLKAVLRDGALALDGQDIATRGGKLTGKASVDARGAVPYVSASFSASGVEVYDVLQSIGVTALIAGTSKVEANLTGSGTSQRQIVDTLSGRVTAEVGRGSIVGYDFSNVLSWLFGDRTWDPRQRTPFNRLDAALTLDNGVTRDSKVTLDGPIVGGNADGTIRLPLKEIDYRARFSLSSFFSALSLRIFGEWDRPSVTPDLDVFSRSPGDQMSPAEMLAGTDLADPELATLISKVIDEAGPRKLQPAVVAALRSLKAQAEAKGR